MDRKSNRALSSRCMAGAVSVGGVLCHAALVQPVMAQSERLQPGAGLRPALEEIVVTARRREEFARNVPVAVSVISAEDIAAAGDTLDRGRQLVPALQMFAFSPRTTSISLRGLGGNGGLANDGLETSVGLFIDDVYLGRAGPALFELVDIERIEVLRGPQGTLFGKNTTAGAINIVTKAPSFDELTTAATVAFGEYGFQQLKAVVDGPFGETVAGRVSLADTQRDGFIENMRTGGDLQDYDNFTARGQLLIAPMPNLDVRLIGDYGRQKLDCCVNVAAGLFEQLDNGAQVPDNYLLRTARLGYTPLPFTPFERKVDVDSRIGAEMSHRGLSAQVTRTFRDLELKSITAYRDWDWDPANDADEIGLPVVLVAQQPSRQRQTSQELRVASLGDRRIDYIGGLYHFDQAVDGQGWFVYGPVAPEWYFPPPSAQPLTVREAALSDFGTESKTASDLRSTSLFGQGTWHATDALDLMFGLRFTHEDRRGSFEQIQVAGPLSPALPPASIAAVQAIRASFGSAVAYGASVSDDAVSGMINLSYRLTPNALGYITYSRGSKSAGLNLANLPPGIDPVVEPETTDHYEAGVKTAWVDNSVTLDVAIYRTKLFDYQTSVLDPSAAGGRLVAYISNVDEARSEGIEVDGRWAISERFALSAGVAYTDAVYVSHPTGPCPVEVTLTPARCDLSGLALPGAPKRAWSLALDGNAPLSGALELHARLDYSRRSDAYTGLGNSRYSKVAGYGLVNLAVGVRMIARKWDATLWARNLTDQDYFQVLAGRTSGLINGVTGEPRTVGVTLSAQF